jgi:hypothetical protein
MGATDNLGLSGITLSAVVIVCDASPPRPSRIRTIVLRSQGPKHNLLEGVGVEPLGTGSGSLSSAFVPSARLSNVQMLAALAAWRARRLRGGDRRLVGSLAHKVKTATSTFKPDNEGPPTLHTQAIADHMGSTRRDAAALAAIMLRLDLCVFALAKIDGCECAAGVWEEYWPCRSSMPIHGLIVPHLHLRDTAFGLPRPS